MCNSGIYQIMLKLDGRSYIGSAKNIEARWRAHVNNANNQNLKIKQVISHAIAKYGPEKFEWIVLESCPPAELISREQYWLDTIGPYVETGKGFNVRKDADSNLGITRTLESRKKQSATMTGVPKTDEHRKNMSKNWHKNRGEEYYAQLSAKISGDKNPATRPEVKEKISKSMTGKKWGHDLARVAKHSEQRRGKKYTEEEKGRMRIAQQKNNTRSAAAKEKFSLAQRRLYQISGPVYPPFTIYSKELKVFCVANGLSYSNLISTSKTGKLYKGGWMAKVITNPINS